MPDFATYINAFRSRIGDDDASAYFYSDSQLAYYASTAMGYYNRRAPRQIVFSGSVSTSMTLPDDLSVQETQIIETHWDLSVAEAERARGSRRGFSVSDVAGRLDGRERFLSARDQVNELRKRIDDLESLRDNNLAAGAASVLELTRSSGSSLGI